MKIRDLFTKKPKGHATLSAVITAGPETAAKLGVPVGTKIDLGVISESDLEGWGVKA